MTTGTKKINDLVPTLSEFSGLQEKQKKHSQNDIAIHGRYGDGKKFAETFNPDLQRACSENLLRTFTGDALRLQH